jgi:hypothetical protein
MSSLSLKKVIMNKICVRFLQFTSVAVLLLAVISPAIPASALTYKAIRDINNYKSWYDVNDTTTRCSSSSGDTTLVGSDNAEKIYNYFVTTAGLKPFQAAAFMGNMNSESTMNPRALEPGTTGDAPIAGRGYGLIQWTFPVRQDPLIARAKAANKPVFDLTVQLDYIMYEITDGPEPYKSVGPKLKATTDIRSATLLIETQYEVHGGGIQPIRLSDARKFLTKYGSNSGTPSTNNQDITSCAASSTTGTNEVVGEFSLPVDKKWYTQNKTWFTKPHHDYPAADIPVPSGTPVYSMTGGKIIKAPAQPANQGYGLGVIIDAGNGVTFTYGHGIDGGSVPGARQGDTVEPGQLIMHSGSTGSSTGPHLHVDIRTSNGQKYCPQNLLVAIATNKPVPSISALPTSGCTN